MNLWMDNVRMENATFLHPHSQHHLCQIRSDVCSVGRERASV